MKLGKHGPALFVLAIVALVAFVLYRRSATKRARLADFSVPMGGVRDYVDFSVPLPGMVPYSNDPSGMILQA